MAGQTIHKETVRRVLPAFAIFLRQSMADGIIRPLVPNQKLSFTLPKLLDPDKRNSMDRYFGTEYVARASGLNTQAGIALLTSANLDPEIQTIFLQCSIEFQMQKSLLVAPDWLLQLQRPQPEVPLLTSVSFWYALALYYRAYLMIEPRAVAGSVRNDTQTMESALLAQVTQSLHQATTTDLIVIHRLVGCVLGRLKWLRAKMGELNEQRLQLESQLKQLQQKSTANGRFLFRFPSLERSIQNLNSQVRTIMAQLEEWRPICKAFVTPSVLTFLFDPLTCANVSATSLPPDSGALICDPKMKPFYSCLVQEMVDSYTAALQVSSYLQNRVLGYVQQVIESVNKVEVSSDVDDVLYGGLLFMTSFYHLLADVLHRRPDIRQKLVKAKELHRSLFKTHLTSMKTAFEKIEGRYPLARPPGNMGAFLKEYNSYRSDDSEAQMEDLRQQIGIELVGPTQVEKENI